ncbi:hypothetical protein [Actinoallomurus sp. NPDC050550]|uniref:hypothetical protein n=1 Tax=Actinoallomurus sp. NPDC050550 TaxID=3154937 RepID=UPI0033C979DF
MALRRWGAVLVVGTAVLTPVAAHADTGYVPGQFIAKQYTEALGRAPDQAGWRGDVGYFESDGCNATTLANVGRSIYTSSEFTGLGYDNDARVLALYRGALNREHLELIPWRGRRIRVPSLKIQLAVAERRGLADRAALIRQAMRS